MSFLKRFSNWPWLRIIEVIAVPLVLLFITYKINEAQGIAAEDDQRYAILSDYFDDMTQLQLSTQLRETLTDGASVPVIQVVVDGAVQSLSQEDRRENSKKAQAIASAMTLSALRQLGEDGDRKGQLLKFLAEGELIGSQCPRTPGKVEADSECNEPLLGLGNADFQNTRIDSPISLRGANLRKALLEEADLTGIDLTKAKMQDANLEMANLTAAILSDAKLMKANLQDTTLVCAALVNADLSNSNLTGANLQKADLREANLSQIDWKRANFRGAVYNKATVFPNGFDKNKEGVKLFNPDEPVVHECGQVQTQSLSPLQLFLSSPIAPQF